MLSYSHQLGQACGLPSHFLLISEDNPFTKRATRGGWLTLFIVWYQESHRKRAFKQTLKSATDSSFFRLHVWIIGQSVWAGKTQGIVCNVQLLFGKLFLGFLDDVLDIILKFCPFASCIHVWASPGPTTWAQADKDLAVFFEELRVIIRACDTRPDLLFSEFISSHKFFLVFTRETGLLLLTCCKLGWLMCLLKACPTSFFSSFYTVAVIVTCNYGRNRNVSPWLFWGLWCECSWC